MAAPGSNHFLGCRRKSKPPWKEKKLNNLTIVKTNNAWQSKKAMKLESDNGWRLICQKRAFINSMLQIFPPTHICRNLQTMQWKLKDPTKTMLFGWWWTRQRSGSWKSAVAYSHKSARSDVTHLKGRPSTYSHKNARAPTHLWWNTLD